MVATAFWDVLRVKEGPNYALQLNCGVFFMT
jgi:hypothetical protein